MARADCKSYFVSPLLAYMNNHIQLGNIFMYTLFDDEYNPNLQYGMNKYIIITFSNLPANAGNQNWSWPWDKRAR